MRPSFALLRHTLPSPRNRSCVSGRGVIFLFTSRGRVFLSWLDTRDVRIAASRCNADQLRLAATTKSVFVGALVPAFQYKERPVWPVRPFEPRPRRFHHDGLSKRLKLQRLRSFLQNNNKKTAKEKQRKLTTPTHQDNNVETQKLRRRAKKKNRKADGPQFALPPY